MKSVTVWFLDYELAEKSILIYINLPIKVLENKIPEYVAKKNTFTFKTDYKILSLKII